jgi:hypothetical protein
MVNWLPSLGLLILCLVLIANTFILQFGIAVFFIVLETLVSNQLLKIIAIEYTLLCNLLYTKLPTAHLNHIAFGNAIPFRLIIPL